MQNRKFCLLISAGWSPCRNKAREWFCSTLTERLGTRATVTTKGGSAVILTEDPKEALSKIAELSQAMGIQLEWLNVRKNTLEDVFLRSVGHGGESIASA